MVHFVLHFTIAAVKPKREVKYKISENSGKREFLLTFFYILFLGFGTTSSGGSLASKLLQVDVPIVSQSTRKTGLQLNPRLHDLCWTQTGRERLRGIQGVLWFVNSTESSSSRVSVLGDMDVSPQENMASAQGSVTWDSGSTVQWADIGK